MDLYCTPFQILNIIMVGLFIIRAPSKIPISLMKFRICVVDRKKADVLSFKQYDLRLFLPFTDQ